ncbi:MAG: pyridoxal-phosphate dependent enzyme [Chloroflexi bacterium]|nr:pyridoxal-phosphate dependent enzyme [Chloroflexota bacterium]
MMAISCTNCGRPYPEEGLPYNCPVCSGVYDFSSPWAFDRSLVDESQPGIWRYRAAFGLSADIDSISLGEGNTPLLRAKAFGREIAFKCEFQNPTGSFKDRGSAVIAGWLRARGISEFVEDSSGNAGASLAAYAARSGIKANIYVPASASGPKRRQIEALGADLVPVPGSRSDVAEAVRRAADGGAVYASHAYLPFNLPGYATASYEIFEQLGSQMPGAIVLPAGQGGLLLGMARGFDALRIANNIYKNIPTNDKNNKLPKIIGVQARACAPLWAMFAAGREGLRFVAENPTLAEGVKVRVPVRGAAVLREVAAGNGSICAVDEGEILPGREALAHLGFHVEPTSAIVWSALEQTISQLPDPVVVILTGSGYKYE